MTIYVKRSLVISAEAMLRPPWILLLSFYICLRKATRPNICKKECLLFLLHYHFPMEDSSESFERPQLIRNHALIERSVAFLC